MVGKHMGMGTGITQTMGDLEKTLGSLSPFNFLTHQEMIHLLKASVIRQYKPKTSIYRISDSVYDYMSVLLQGHVVVKVHGKKINTIEALSYFGERSILFRKRRMANIIAINTVSCLEIPGEVIRSLIKKNRSFSHAFAEIMNNKHNLFSAYHEFVTMLYKYRNEETLNLVDLIPYYIALDPLLHKHAKSDDINFSALSYAISRLPNNITSISHFFLSNDLPGAFLEHVDVMRPGTNRARKRLYLNVLPGKLFVVLRDEMTDFIDFVTKLCLYYCETQKIIKKSILFPLADDNRNHNVVNEIIDKTFKKIDISDDVLLNDLSMTASEKKQIRNLFGSNLASHLYGIIVQNGFLDIHIKKPDARYHILAQEIWLNQIQQTFRQFIGKESSLQQHEIHIVFSNNHSVNNCLSSWIHVHKNEIMMWGEANVKEAVDLKNEANKLYVYLRHWLKKHPERYLARINDEKQHGIMYINDTNLNGVDVNLIDLSKIQGLIDPYFKDIDTKNFKKKIIINVDYAYGHQAETCIKSLILLFGKSIKSISIMGKAGGIIGNRGDIIIPNNILVQKDNSFIPIENQRITEKDLKASGWKKDIHRGNILTVLGTLMQNQEMLEYYKLFWDVIGMEMEAAHYMKEINTAIVTDMLDKSVDIHVAYYISDTPLKLHSDLSKQMKPSEGVPAVYAITRAMLRRILLAH